MANDDNLRVYRRGLDDDSQLLESGSTVEYHFSESVVHYKGKKVLVVQADHVLDGNPWNFGIIPGNLVRKEGDEFYVEIIEDAREREDIINLLKSEVRGPIKFWEKLT